MSNGIFEYDPAISTAAPRRFKSLTWTEANLVGGGIVQPKAIDYGSQPRVCRRSCRPQLGSAHDYLCRARQLL
jgi:hypothetical protein